MNSVEKNTLPEGWKLVKFDDLFKITSSKRVHKKDWVFEGVPFYRAREIVKLSNNGFVDNELFITKKMFDEFNEKYGSPEEDDILVTGVGTLGICYIVKPNDKFYFKDGNIIWFKKKVEVESRYVEYGFQSDYVRNQVYSGGGSTVATYTIIRAKNTTIPLPPLKEQKRIVAKIDTLFAKIDKAISLTEESLKQAKNLLPSVLKEVFEKGKADGWEEKKLGEVCKIIGGGTPSKKVKSYWGGNIKWATVGDMNCEVIVETDNMITNIGLENSSSNLVSNDAVIIATRVGLGKVCLLESDTAINQDLKGILPNEYLDKLFVYYYFKNISKYIISNGTGATVKGVKLSFINDLTIPLPPLEEQIQVSVLFDKISEKFNQTQSKLEEQLDYLKQLKSSILSKAFKGEL